MNTLLLSWLGKTDLRAVEDPERIGVGPVARALQTGRFAALHLLCDCSESEANAYVRWLAAQVALPVTLHPVELPNPMDFGAIYRQARQVVATCAERLGDGDRLTFHLSPGTPAMAAVWIILAKTRFPADLIQSSLSHGVEPASVPFDISADFIPDLLDRPDRELERLTAGLPPEAPEFSAILHRSAVMQRVLARARRAALRSIPVLIEGESGTGKELLARAIHRASPRREQPFVTVNCGAIAPELVESELFGHEKGAFTGADRRRLGYFEAAHGGTLFLDEVGELPKPAQVRFLRALQEQEVTRVGATQPIGVDVRMVAATNRSLIEEVAAGRFREDLFYRLAVAVIQLPPLREREDDAGLLLDRLLDQVNRESVGEPSYEPKKISVTARKLLLQHRWPGNIRELLNTLRRAAVWTPGSLIDVDDARDALLPSPVGRSTSDSILSLDVRQGIDLDNILDQVERHYLDEAMHVAGGTKTRAAALLGLGSATTLTNRLKKHQEKS
jgi:DNA-binding NtrC family response regulator